VKCLWSEPDCDVSGDLKVIKELWIEKLKASGELLYRDTS